MISKQPSCSTDIWCLHSSHSCIMQFLLKSVHNIPQSRLSASLIEMMQTSESIDMANHFLVSHPVTCSVCLVAENLLRTRPLSLQIPLVVSFLLSFPFKLLELLYSTCKLTPAVFLSRLTKLFLHHQQPELIAYSCLFIGDVVIAGAS